MSWCETECKKKCAIGEQIEVFILGGQKIEGEERGLRKGAERGYREKRDKRELS